MADFLIGVVVGMVLVAVAACLPAIIWFIKGDG